MIVRGFSRCCCTRPLPSVCRYGGGSFRPATLLRGPRPARGRRPFSTPAGGSAGGAPSSSSSPAAMLAPFTNEIDRIAPSFRVNGSQIRVLKTPSEFYETLKTKIRGAKSRIFLSTLYIGKSEKELIATLQEALRANPELKVYILTDALRGTRESPEPSSASLLAPLVDEFGAGRVEIRMYHTPNLTGYRKKYIPRRINEGWGLQHMKLYGVDDEVILSGANLSTDYFTNRQDRYHLFSSRDITEYFWRLHSGVASLSYLIRPSRAAVDGFEMVWPATNAGPSPLDRPAQFVSAATAVMGSLISPKAKLPPSKIEGARGEDDTSVYVVSQMSQLLKPDTSTELPAITHILKTLARPQYANSSWTFTAGYFNPAPSLTKLLLSTVSHNNTVITASPYANGFYMSPGVSGLLPDAYTFLAHRFLKAVHSQGRDSAITLKEWRNGTVGEPNGWTYHAKGLWVTLPGDSAPSMTLIGSSNYTKRSYSLDLEANALIVTRNDDLKKRLGEEQQWLQDHATAVTLDDFAKNDRRVSFKVRAAMWIVQLVGGAL